MNQESAGFRRRSANRADDLLAAWRLYRLLRAWRDGALAGHVWVRVGLHPGHAPTVRPVRYVAARSFGLAGGGRG